jgi:hypothetical protein
MEGDKARRSSAYGRIERQGFTVRGLGGGEEAGDSIFLLNGGREAAESADQRRIATVAFGARWVGAWSVREGKWSWKAGTVDEGEHLGAFNRPGEEGSVRGRRRNNWRWWGASMALDVSALKGGAERMGRGTISRRGGQAVRSTQLPWARRSWPAEGGGGYTDRRWQQLQLLREEEDEGGFGVYAFA